MYNAILLLKGEDRFARSEWNKVDEKEGSTIWQDGANPQELKRWGMEQKKEALEEFEKCKCQYVEPTGDFPGYIKEFALEYCECDDDGEFVQGSDYDLAEKI